MRKVLIGLSIVATLHSVAAMATCMGDESLKTCFDQNGNSYLVQRFGDTTTVQGSNPYTGNTWSQTSQTMGDTTFTNGIAADGNSWNATTQSIGGMTFTNGMDSDGNAFSSTCTAYGCF